MLTTEARVGAVGRAAFPMRPTNQSWSMHPRSSSRNASKNQRMRTPPSPTLGTSDGVNSSVETSLKTIELPDVHARKRTQNLETISTSNHTTREENELKDLSTSPIKLTTDRKIQEMLDDAQRNSRQLKKRYQQMRQGVNRRKPSVNQLYHDVSRISQELSQLERVSSTDGDESIGKASTLEAMYASIQSFRNQAVHEQKDTILITQKLTRT